MGWAIGSSVGTAMARPEVPTVCITGDGSVLMSGGDITVAIQEQLNILFIILNDSEYGMVKHGQRLGSGEPIAFSLPKIDFALWAKSMGIEAFTIQSSQDLEQCDFEHFAQSSGPVILDVMVDPEEVPPIQNRIQALIQSSS
jgi:acetolactate synthase-1/2/3 large subunit